jgi:hypothetical protein
MRYASGPPGGCSRRHTRVNIRARSNGVSKAIHNARYRAKEVLSSGRRRSRRVAKPRPRRVIGVKQGWLTSSCMLFSAASHCIASHCRFLLMLRFQMKTRLTTHLLMAICIMNLCSLYNCCGVAEWNEHFISDTQEHSSFVMYLWLRNWNLL